jgi:hypothetical protein
MKNFTLGVVGVSLLCFMAGCESSGISARDPDGQSTTGLVQAFCMQPTTQPLNGNRAMHYPAVLAVAQIGEINPPREMIEVLQKDRDHFSAVLSMPALTSSNSDGSAMRNGVANRVY